MKPNNQQHPRFSVWQEYAQTRRECRIRRRAIILSSRMESTIDPDHHGRKLYSARIRAAALRKLLYAPA